MKCLVTGGAGFIGSNLVDKLIEFNHDVTVLDNLSTGKKQYVNKHAKLLIKDIRNYTDISNCFNDINTVFHVAALPRVEPSIKDPISFNDINVNGTLNVLMAAKKSGVTKIIFSSSSSVYGDCGILPVNEEKEHIPISPYALQKSISEQYCKLFSFLYGINTICLRYFNVYGKRQPEKGAYVPVVGIFFKQKKDHLSLTVTGDGKQTRDFINVLDVVNSNICAMHTNNLPKFSYFNIGSGTNYRVIDIAHMIDNNIQYIAERIEPKTTLADISKAKKFLDWHPKITLTEWINKNLPLYMEDNHV